MQYYMIQNQKNSLFLLLLLGMLASCKYSEEFRIIEKPGAFSMEVPEYVKALDDVNGTSDFQYGNKFRNFYVVVEQRDKSPNFSTTDYAQESLRQLMAPATFTEPDTIELKEVTDLNGLKGRHLIMTAKIGTEKLNRDVLYHLLHLEGEKGLYHVALWTWAEWEEKYKEVIPRMLGSFQEQ